MEKLIYLTIFLLPTYLLRFSVGKIPTNLFEILVVIILVSYLWNFKKYIPVKNFTGYKKYSWPVFLILAGLFISTFWNCYFSNVLTAVSTSVSTPAYTCSTGLGILKGWFLVPLVFVFLVRRIVPREKIKNIFRAYYLSALGVAIISLFFLLSEHLTFDGRLEGIFNSPNYLAMYLAPAVIMFFFKTLETKNRALNTISVVSLLIVLSALYKTYSYASWTATLISILIVSLINYKISFKKIVLSLAIFFLLLFSQIHDKKLNTFFDSRSSSASRIMIWNSSKKILKDNFLFGIGPENFQNKYLAYQKYFPPYLEWAVPHPHNVFLAFWLSGGILSLAGFVWIIALFSKNIFSRLKHRKTLAQKYLLNAAYVSLGIIFYILLHGLVDTTIFKNDLAVVFWLCLLAI